MAMKFRSVLVELEPEQIELLLEGLHYVLEYTSRHGDDEVKKLYARLEKELELVMTPA